MGASGHIESGREEHRTGRHCLLVPLSPAKEAGLSTGRQASLVKATGQLRTFVSLRVSESPSPTCLSGDLTRLRYYPFCIRRKPHWQRGILRVHPRPSPARSSGEIQNPSPNSSTSVAEADTPAHTWPRWGIVTMAVVIGRRIVVDRGPVDLVDNHRR